MSDLALRSRYFDNPAGSINGCGSLPTMVKSVQKNPYLSAFSAPNDSRDDNFMTAMASAFQKAYTKKDMNTALDALKTKKMTLTRASETYGIPATTLWQRANRLGDFRFDFRCYFRFYKFCC